MSIDRDTWQRRQGWQGCSGCGETHAPMLHPPMHDHVSRPGVLDAVCRAGTPPQRIQRSRAKGWRMPERAVYVGRPTVWGNPFLFAADSAVDLISRIVVQKAYRSWITAEVTEHRTIDLGPLRGRDLACWCRPDQPCHADVLLELANG